MTVPYDVVIAGSGPLGLAAARRLAERGASCPRPRTGRCDFKPARIALSQFRQFIQRARQLSSEATKYLEFIDDGVSRDALLGAAVTRTVGGQGAIWTNLCPRGDALWPAMSDKEWARRYEVAEDYLRVQTDRLDRSIRQKRIGARLEDFFKAKGREVAPLPVAGRYLDAAFCISPDRSTF